MSTRIGYVVRDRFRGSYWMRGGAFEPGIQTATVFDGDDQVTVIQSWRIVPVRVTEEPGPPIREVVELRGTVDLDGLKFAIAVNDDIGARGLIFWAESGKWVNLADSWVSDTLATAEQKMAKYRLDASRIVGIREIPGPSVRRVEEITPEMLR